MSMASPHLETGRLFDGMSPRLHAALCAERALDGFRRVRDVLYPDADIVSCATDRVHFGSRLGIVVDYALELKSAGGEITSVRAFGQLPWGDPDGAFRAARTKLTMKASGDGEALSAPRIALVHDNGIVLRARGVDERIDLLNWREAADGRCMAEIPIPWRSGGYRCARVLTHRLGKRAVLHLVADPEAGGYGDAIVKLFARRSPTAAVSAQFQTQIAASFRDVRDRIRVPAIRAVSEEWPGIVMDHVGGVSLSRVPRHERRPALFLAGEAIARLHAAEVGPLARYGAADEIALLERWVAFVETLDRRQGARLRRVLAHVSRRLQACDLSTETPIHRDFHEQQVLCRDGGVALIDFDTMRRGDPAQDVGNFLAHLRLSDCLADQGQSEAMGLFRDAYGLVSRQFGLATSPRNVTAHMQATLLRLALINWFSDRNRFVVAQLIEEASV